MMKKLGVATEMIIQVTGLSREEIERLGNVEMGEVGLRRNV
jgi:hypothetical protein